MKYQRVQFKEKVVVTKSPYIAIGEAESLDVPTAEPARAYLIEDDGDRHIRITKAVGGVSVRVPWSNVAAAVTAPEVVPVIVPPIPEPQGFPELPRVTPTPKKRDPKW